MAVALLGAARPARPARAPSPPVPASRRRRRRRRDTAAFGRNAQPPIRQAIAASRPGIEPEQERREQGPGPEQRRDILPHRRVIPRADRIGRIKASSRHAGFGDGLRGREAAGGPMPAGRETEAESATATRLRAPARIGDHAGPASTGSRARSPTVGSSRDPAGRGVDRPEDQAGQVVVPRGEEQARGPGHRQHDHRRDPGIRPDRQRRRGPARPRSTGDRKAPRTRSGGHRDQPGRRDRERQRRGPARRRLRQAGPPQDRWRLPGGYRRRPASAARASPRRPRGRRHRRIGPGGGERRPRPATAPSSA